MDADDDASPEPVTRESLGRATWTFLHTLAASQPATASPASAARLSRFVTDFTHVYPCRPCAASLRAIVARSPPDAAAAAGGAAFAGWMCRVHNEVNAEIGKEAFDCAKVAERWGVCESCENHEEDLGEFFKVAGLGKVIGGITGASAKRGG